MTTARRGARALACGLALAACARADPDRPWTPEELEVVLSLSPLPAPPPSANPHADDPRAATLGRDLFFDPALSADGRVSCASCHEPARYFTDGRARSRGLAAGERNALSVMTAPFFPFLSWDGRKDSLLSQSLRPLEAPHEMALPAPEAARVIASRHRAAYEAAFGPPPDPGAPGGADAIYLNAGRALEAYQRRLVPGRSPFDDYVAALRAGDPEGGGVLSPAARRGLRVFVGAGRCASCHAGPLLSDGEFHNLGLPPGSPGGRDPGRALGVALVLADPLRCDGSGESGCEPLRYLDPTFPEHLGAFRTPSLRNVAETAPYMHAGQLATLEEVIAFYAQRPGVPTVGARDPLLRLVPRRLPSADLVAFLRTLTGALPGPEWLGPPTAGAAGEGGVTAPTGAGAATAVRPRPAGRRRRSRRAGRSRRTRR